MTEGEKTIGEVLTSTKKRFAKKGIETWDLDAEVLLAHLLGKERVFLYIHPEEKVPQEKLSLYNEWIDKRLRDYSIAHILGEKEFMGLAFKVTEDVLVPRPETEILAETVIKRLQSLPSPRIADIGTGTGAIALSILANLSECTASCTDISSKALLVAKENAARLQLLQRAEFFQGDLLAPLTGKKFDAIVSNPPYIPEKDMETLPPEVKREPHLALYGGVDGLDFYRRLAREAPSFLKPNGFLALEVGIKQAEPVAGLIRANPFFTQTEIIKDYSGIDRVVLGAGRWRCYNGI